MKYFTLEELTGSATAKKYKLKNIPSSKEELNLLNLTNRILDPLREAWGSPIKLTCAYRSKAVNAKV